MEEFYFKLKYEVWPVVKTRLFFWWWVVRYRGAKNIPPEVIVAQMEKSMKRLNENLHSARVAGTDGDADKEELREVYDAIGKVEDLEKELNKLERKVKDDSLNEKENKN
jgi:hypothetical protein